jgi:hypothetical protein
MPDTPVSGEPAMPGEPAGGPGEPAGGPGEPAMPGEPAGGPGEPAEGPGEPAGAWVEPSGGRCPPSHPIKAKLRSQLYHLPGMAAYERTSPDRCYRDEAAAEADGLRRAKR